MEPQPPSKTIDSAGAPFGGADRDALTHAVAPTEPVSGVRGDGSISDKLLHGKYRLTRLIGKGGFGTVYEAKDERGAGNRVAIKVVNPEYSSDPRLVRAFRAEARRMTRLSHPNIVDWKNFDADESGICYFVMELVEGEELDKLLARKGPVPHDRVARILLQVLDALRAAHHLAEGGSVLHLDLKPRNVFLVPPRANRPEQVKVIDFGIGQHVGEDADEGPAIPGGPNRLETSANSDFNPTTLRFHDATFEDPPGLRRCQGCTPEYASPEQAAHVLGLPNVLQLDGRSDLYSLGVMAYQMLTGELPFARPVLRTDYLRLHVSGQPRPISASQVKIPRNLARFVERCLAKDREQRFPDAHAAHAALERIVRPPVALRVAVAGVVLVVAAVAFGGWLVRAAEPGHVLASDTPGARPMRTLWAGPEHAARQLSFRPLDLVGPGVELELFDVSDGSVLAGSRVTVPAPGRLELALPTTLGDGRVPKQVRIEGSAARFEPFEIVWLGAKAWEVASVRAGTFDLRGTTRAVAVDPSGLELEVVLAGEGRNEIERVQVSAPSGTPIDLADAGSQDGRRVWRAGLGRFALPAGRSALALHVVDLSGREHREDLALEVVTQPASLEALELCELRAGAQCESFVQLAGRYLLPPGARVHLRGRASRPAKVEWRLRYDDLPDAESDWTGAPSSDGRSIDIELAPFIEKQERRTGTVELRLDDGESVARAVGHAPTGQRVLFEVSPDRADFTARLVASPGMETTLSMGSPTWVSTRDLEVIVFARGRSAMKVALSDGSSSILEGGVREQRLPLRFATDGIHPLTIQASRFDTTDRAVADRPDVEQRYEIGVDTSRPILAMPGGIDGVTFRGREALATALTVPAIRDSGSPITVGWQLGSLPRVIQFDDRSSKAPLSRVCSELPDGDWRFALEACDLAGNCAVPVEARFRLACAGPTIYIEEPRAGNWARDPDGWLVQVRAQDSNGLADVGCTIVAESGERFPLALVPGGDAIYLDVGEGLPSSDPSGAPVARERQLRGHARLPHAWSNRLVHVEIEAHDATGMTNTESRLGLILPYIAPPKPSALVSANKRGATLRLVSGNDGGVYQFGGRGDDVENAEHRRAGLEAFAPAGTSRSWNVTYAAGAIADFYLEDREVTRGEFLAFVRAPDGWAQTEHFFSGRPPAPTRRAELEGRLAPDPGIPVTGVTWEEAAAFAHWSGRRLPTWVELEYAMRGGPSNYRPFAGFAGRAPGTNEVNARGLGPGRAWSVGMGGDVTRDTAIRDLAGNVREWTSTPIALLDDGRPSDPATYFDEHKERLLLPVWDAETTEFWVAGGSYARKNYFFESATASPRNACADDLGFRCALSLEAARDAMESRRLEETQ